jgi:hypothetical protein
VYAAVITFFYEKAIVTGTASETENMIYQNHVEKQSGPTLPEQPPLKKELHPTPIRHIRTGEEAYRMF